MRSSRRVAMATALALLLAACGGGDGVFSSTTAGSSVPDAQSGATGVAPEFLIIDQDPASPISMTVGFADNDEGLQMLVVLGEKVPSTRPPEAVLIYAEGEAEPFSMTFDSEGRLRQFLAPDGSEIRVLSYQGTQATLAAIAPDGTAEVATVEVPEVDPGILEDLAAPAGRTAGRASDRPGERVPALSTVVATATGSYSTQLPAGFDPSNVLLRAGECRVPPIANVPTTSSGSYVACQASIGVDEIVVRSTVDVPALYGGELPAELYETVESCELRGVGLAVGGVLLMGGTLVVLGAAMFAVASAATLGGALAWFGFGTVAGFANGALGGGMIYLAGRPCTGAFTTNEGLRLDVQDRLQGLTATVGYTPVLLREPDHYSATAQPPQLQFAPFAAAGPQRLDAVVVSVVPLAEPDGGDTDSSTSSTTTTTIAAGRVVADGAFIVPTVVPVEVVENEIRIVIRDREVRITRLAWYTVTGYTGFEVGDDETFEAPCKNHSSWELLDLQASYDPTTGAITGTATMLWDRIDIGTECPFGGMDVEQTRTMALEATLSDGVIEGTFREADDLLPESVGMAFTATVAG